MDEVKYIDKDIVERRMVSYCIDNLFIWIIIFFMEFRNLSSNTVEILKITFRDLVVLDIIYHYLCYLKFDTTIGGLICNIKLVDKNNQKLTNIKKLERVILKIITKYFALSILLLSTCIDKVDTWYDKILGINFVIDKDEDEGRKRMILSLKFNCVLNSGIIGGLMIFIILTRFILFVGYSVIEIFFSGSFIVELLIKTSIFIIFLNIILSPFRERYIINSLEKDRVEKYTTSDIELEISNEKNLDVIRNAELDIINENKN